MNYHLTLAQFARAMQLAAVPALILAATLSVPAAAQQSYPTKPVRMIVPYPPGGGTDIAGRRLAEYLTVQLGQPITVDNRGGANAIVGTEAVARAAPDGYTIMVSTLAAHAANPSMYKRLPYDAIKDFAPVSVLSAVPLVLVVHPSLPAKNVSELLQLAKARPGAMNYASWGTGGMGHLAAELLKMVGGIDMTHIPYKGGGPALIATMAGEAPIYFSGVNSALPYIQTGRLRPVAVTGSTRSKPLPDVPTVAETSKFKGYEATVATGVWLPAGTPQDIIAKLHAAVINVVHTPKYRDSLDLEGSEPIGNTPEQMAVTLAGEIDKLAKVIKAAGIKPE